SPVFGGRRVRDSPQREAVVQGHALAMTACSVGLLIALLAAAVRTDPVGPWPWTAGALAIALLLHRLGALRGHWGQPLLGSLGAGCVLWLWARGHEQSAALDEPAPFLGLVFGSSLVILAASFARRGRTAFRVEMWSVALFTVLGFFALSVAPNSLEALPLPLLVTLALLGIVIAVA